MVTIICKLNEANDRAGKVEMEIAFGRYALTSLWLVLSVTSTLVRSQAPDDASGDICTKPTVPDGVVRLLDSGWYQSLLSGGTNAAGWTQTPGDSVSE